MIVDSIACVAALLLLLWGISRLAERGRTRSVPFKVVRADGPFEVRDYPAMTLVETGMEDRSRKNVNNGFRRLFNFINGLNTRNRKIPMTTPVLISDTEAAKTMAFVMPADMDESATPAPTDPSLRVRATKPARYAVLRFSGFRSPEREAEAGIGLFQWLMDQGIEAEAEPVFGYFDPPWVPGFLRRNEAMIKIK